MQLRCFLKKSQANPDHSESFCQVYLEFLYSITYN
ncbi:hypothetical protein TOT_020000735 [Theileria orientalis strain Shintoku]|uniref:Uncharacterized protein n=1 Tax=Theileria orientalis strain Shintoku TaxID=869250 RepID=J4DPC8_THEOR|nr:hypothetical protein TOT_020000735 [Theileria orientalis strain Shintoku]BAM40479.1 hypothetical protein TOT_020000735 [Theileria orientalis strain Shintoku]|eukprot:XP_009690780.1 hypothetical protein TOT_020000735 [Theileria orientalis strain Shintoku]